MRRIARFGRGSGGASRSSIDPLTLEARGAGMHSHDLPSLEAVERRRSELWVTVFLVILGLAVAVVLLTVSTEQEELRNRIVRLPGFRIGLAGFPIFFFAFIIEKERHLRRVERLLIDERVLTAALANRLKELATLNEAGKAVNSVLALEDVLDIILSSAVELLGAGSGSIMLADSPGELRVVSELGNAPARGARVQVGSGIAGRVAETREPLLLTGVLAREDGAPRTVPVSSALCVPLVNRGELLGVLSTNRAGERPFNEYDLRALGLFAEHAAAAITNANLYETERSHVAELVELDRMKSEFVATVSHELRTPLTSILGSAQTLQRRDLPPERIIEFAEMIERHGTRLLHLIEDILELQRTVDVESVECRPTDVTKVLEEVVRLETAAGHPVRLHAPPELFVNGNAELLQRVFTNLIDNAFSHGGGDVDVTAEQVEQDGWPEVRIGVLDRGPGVPPQDADAIFERFLRGRGALVPGMGLGLYMVRTLVEAQRGRVWVTSRDGGGAAFYVALPPPGHALPLRPTG